MADYNEQVNRLWDEWIAETGQASGDPAEFVEWAVASRRLALRPQDVNRAIRKQVTQALRQQKRWDFEGGFTYRAKQSVTLLQGGNPVKHYFDTDKGGTQGLRQKSTKQRREAIAHDAYRAVCDVERMNKMFPDDPQLNFFADFREDVIELRKAEQLGPPGGDADDDDDEDAA